MKKLTTLMMALFLVGGLLTPVFATEPTTVITEENTAQTQSSTTSTTTNLRDGEPGRGTVENATEYWETNGYPDYVSYAFEAGGRMLDDVNSVSYWEIGLVDGDDGIKEEVLDLLDSTCLVTFIDCTYSYAQRIAAYDEIIAWSDPNIAQVTLGANTELVHVTLSRNLSLEQQREYASNLVGEYGSFILVMDNELNTDTTTGVAYSGDTGIWSNLHLLWMFALVACGGMGFLLLQQHRLVPVVQTPTGSQVTQGGKPTGKAVVEAIRKSQARPAEDTFEKIMRKLDADQ